MSAPATGAAKAIERLTKEAALVTRKGVEGVTFTPGNEENPLQWKLHITGPAEYCIAGAKRPCPYAGAVFLVTINYPEKYPFEAPTMSFVPGQLYHPNVSRETGEICGDMVTKAFSPTKNTLDLAKLILEFMSEPNMSSPLDMDCAAEVVSDLAAYETKARRAASVVPKA